MNMLEQAIRIAVESHRGQVDKAGEPYILHPLRVMFRLNSEEARQAAVLHDLIEDTEWSLEMLYREGFSENVVTAIAALTRGEGEDYFDFIRRAASHPLAWSVKRADLLDNLDISRIPVPTEQDLRRLSKYQQSLTLLESSVLLGMLRENQADAARELADSASSFDENQKEIIGLLIACQTQGLKRRQDLSYIPPLYQTPPRISAKITAQLPECVIPKCAGKTLFSGYYWKPAPAATPSVHNYYLFLCSACLMEHGEWLWSSTCAEWDHVGAETGPEEIIQEPLLEKVRELTIG